MDKLMTDDLDMLARFAATLLDETVEEDHHPVAVAVEKLDDWLSDEETIVTRGQLAALRLAMGMEIE